MQADQLAEVRKADAFAVTGDFLDDRKGAAQRLHAAARALLGLVVDIGLARLHQLRDRDLAWRGLLVARLQLGARFHGISSPDGRGELYQAVLARQLRYASCEAQLGPYHNSN